MGWKDIGKGILKYGFGPAGYVAYNAVTGEDAPQNSFRASGSRLEHGDDIYDTAQSGFDQAGNRAAPGVSNIERFGGAQINQGPQDQWRNQQQGLAGAVLDRALGRGGPSVAEIQQRQGLDANLKGQMAVAASSRGAISPLQQRNLAQNAATTNQQFVGQQSLLRANEQIGAQGLAGQLLGQGRDQDIGLATNQAGLDQQAGLANMSAENQRRFQNVQAQLAQSGMNDEQQRAFLAQMFGVDRANQMAVMEAQGMNAGVASSNAASKAAYQAGMFGLGGDLLGLASDERAKKNIQAVEHPEELIRHRKGKTGEKDRKAARKAAQREAVEQMLRVEGAERPEELSRERKRKVKSDAYRGAALDVPTIDDRVLTSDKKAKKAVTSEEERKLADMKAREAENEKKWAEQHERKKAQKEARIKLGLEKEKSITPIADTYEEYLSGGEATEKRMRMREAQKRLGLTSDERAKAGTLSVTDKLDALLGAMKPYSFEYKDPESHGHGRRFGTMAQDLEQTEGGREIVEQRADGLKVLNKDKLLGALTAGTGRLNDRLTALEGAFKRKGKKV